MGFFEKMAAITDYMCGAAEQDRDSLGAARVQEDLIAWISSLPIKAGKLSK